MQQYLIVAHDDTDAGALDRRMNSRPAHFDRARALKASGNFISGGAILDEHGKMIGSMMLVQFASPEDLQEWLRTEPYLVGQVWKTVDIRPFRLAEV